MSVRSTVSEGDVLAGKYRVERTLSSGGMGVVVAALHLELQELVCLKLMHGANAATPDETERFLREARAAAKLRGEHVCRVMDVDRLDDGTPFIVMEMLKGSDLAQVLRAQGTMGAAAAAAIVLQACNGLGEAHDAGIVHRDIKPSNLFVTRRRDGTAVVKLLDFGISKATAIADVTITQPEQMIGTPAYMSPEQMRSATSVDVRTDVWGLGAVLFELVTGRLPFPGTTSTEVIANVLTGTLDLTNVPTILAPIIARCLDKDRERRYPSVVVLADELAPIAATATSELVVDTDTARARRNSQRPLEVAPTIAETRPTPRKSRRWLVVAGVGVAIAAAAVVYVATRGHAAASTARRGGTLRIAMGYEDSGFDLYSILRSRNRGALAWVVEPLLRRGDDGAAEPWILDRTELRDGGRTLVLHVRPDVWFHDHPCLPGGHRVTAADIAYSLRVAIDRGQLTLPIRPGGITARGTDEVIITLDGVNSFYEAELAAVMAIPHEVEGCDDIRAMHRPVGTGPFQFEDAPQGTRWRLKRAPKYWRHDAHGEQLPYLDGLELGPTRDVRESLSQLSRGELDVMMEANDQWGGIVELRGVRPTLAPAYAALRIQVAAASWTNRFGLIGVFAGSRQGPLADPRVRTALALALDRTALVAAAGHPVGAATGRFFSTRMWGYDPTLTGFTYDPDRARALVNEIRREHAIEPIMLATVREGAIGRVVVQEAAAVGLEVQLVMINSSKVDEALKQEDGLLGVVTADMFDGEIPGYVDEINLGNRSDRLVGLQRELVGTLSRPDRFKVYQRIEQAMLTEVPTIPIAFADPADMRDDQIFLFGMRVHGFADDVTGFGGANAVSTSWVDSTSQ